MACSAPEADDVVLVSGLRTPFSKFGGALRDVPSVVLGSHALRRLLERIQLPPSCISELYYGVTLPAEVANEGPVSGRQALLLAGFPTQMLSLTIDRGCCSSMTAIQLGARGLQAGRAQWVLAAGAENMGRASFLAPPHLRWGNPRGPVTLKDPLFGLGMDIGGRPVAVDAGEIALKWGVDREQQDAWAAASHEKYFQAKLEGFYDDHVEPVAFPEFDAALDHDELPRPDTTPTSLARLKTVYGSPTITAGNSPGLDSGASAVLLGKRAEVLERGLEPLAAVVDSCSIACAPEEIAVAPGIVIGKLAARCGWDPAGLDALEINEAFAAVPLVSARYLAQKDEAREQTILKHTNVRGGAVALGHPTGASGARIVLQLAKELQARGGGRGIAAICGALGQADAVALVVQ